MKRKRKNDEDTLYQWLNDKRKARIDKEKEQWADGWNNATPSDRVEGCAILFGYLTGVFIVLWACCGLTFSLAFGFSGWYPTLFYVMIYSAMCTFALRIVYNWVYSVYIEEIDDKETIDDE